MLGKNHIITANSIAVTGSILVTRFEPVTKIGDAARDVIIKVIPTEPIGIIVALMLVTLGSLLPDIDNENSMLGRYIHLPLEHRVWTHNAYALGLIVLVSALILHTPYIAVGYFLHLLLDDFSASHIKWFKIGGYKKWVTLYTVGETSEYILVGLIETLCVILIVYPMLV